MALPLSPTFSNLRGEGHGEDLWGAGRMFRLQSSPEGAGQFLPRSLIQSVFPLSEQKYGMIRAGKVSSLALSVRKYHPPLKLAGHVVVEGGLCLGIPESCPGV